MISVLIGLIASLGILYYVRNKRLDRLEQHRERLEEKQEQLLESLRAKKGQEKNPESGTQNTE